MYACARAAAPAPPALEDASLACAEPREQIDGAYQTTLPVALWWVRGYHCLPRGVHARAAAKPIASASVACGLGGGLETNTRPRIEFTSRGVCVETHLDLLPGQAPRGHDACML